MTVTGLMIGSQLVGALENDLIIKTITGTNAKIYGLLSDYIYNEFSIRVQISKLDIEHKLKVIESYVHRIAETTNRTEVIALKGIEDICQKIHNELDLISTKIKEHDQKWFYWARSIDVSYDLINLEEHVHLLDKRFKLFNNVKNN
jgi:metal-responsive CopG/Arc/MetJ family transcriptional regulator